MTALTHRLTKNHKKLSPWAKRIPTEAWRLYDRDIPEFPVIIDIYREFFLIHDKSDSVIDAGKDVVAVAVQALKDSLDAKEELIVVKRRERQEGLKQYEKLGGKNEFFPVQEGRARFLVNLHDYLDTGLFLDHRPMRHRISKEASHGKMLNLFCYTGSFSVVAAQAGAQVTSVDMSATYVDWAIENFKLNELNPQEHHFVRADVLQWLENPVDELFELIFLDPPTFSNSKRMAGDFEVERDQIFLVESCMKRLTPGGTLYFSNTKRKFRLEPVLLSKYHIEDLSTDTIPPDFHDQKIHRCFRIRFGEKTVADPMKQR
jgi:23S rRNA (cytosine1962-C5)-methyltransferase/23S rRNA (guanine2445-N2)-methyltransferase / 23S rRNA (guanine2069-N7)-methyltransferase